MVTSPSKTTYIHSFNKLSSGMKFSTAIHFKTISVYPAPIPVTGDYNKLTNLIMDQAKFLSSAVAQLIMITQVSQVYVCLCVC